MDYKIQNYLPFFTAQNPQSKLPLAEHMGVLNNPND